MGELGELGYYVNELAIADVLLHIAIAAERVAELDRRIAELAAARAALARLVEDCGAAGGGPCPIIQAFEKTPLQAGEGDQTLNRNSITSPSWTT